jgi:RNA polymerase sigma factor (sigma-70 family)
MKTREGAAVGGDEEFSGFFAAEYRALVRTVTLVLHDPTRAEEIAQDAFVQLLRNWSKVCRYESPDAWVRRVAIRLAVRDAKRERRLAQLRLRNVDEAPALDPSMDVDLMAVIKTLPPRQRSVIVLFYYEDRPMEDIARILDCSPSTGWVHLHRARKRLGVLLTEEVGNDVH